MSETLLRQQTPCKRDLARVVFAGQARLLAERAERGLRLDKRSILNFLRVAILLLRGEERL